MKESVALTKSWFEIIINKKAKLNIQTDAESVVKYKELLGNDFSETTTTLGSLESKELTTNPEFAAAFTKLFYDYGINKNSKVGIVMSASFPALAVSTLASLQTLGSDVILISSLGSSTYGANQQNATWIDIEKWLQNRGGLKFHSELVSLGAENDRGEGLLEEGVAQFKDAAVRNGVELYIPNTIEEAIELKTSLMNENKIDLLINIGGNQSALGACSHSSTIPNGYHTKLQTCTDADRGIIFRLNENGIPILNLLNIKELAVKYGIPLQPGNSYGSSTAVYEVESVNKFGVLIILIFFLTIFLSVTILRSKK